MYKKTEKSSQPDIWDFNESCGIALNRDDEWIGIADVLDWDAVEKEYMDLFKSGRGRPAVTARIALGAPIIQKRMRFSDRELVQEIVRSPYYQYFIGLSGLQTDCLFHRGGLIELRKRFGLDILKRISEIFLKRAEPTREHAKGKPEEPKTNGNHGTMIRSVERSTCFIMRYLSAGLVLSPRQGLIFSTADTLYVQRKMMFGIRMHRVENRIVSISQPFVWPIVRGKKRAPVEFGAKYDVGIDEFGHARLEKLSFDASNEPAVLISAIERYRERTGHYPGRMFADQIYRTKANRDYCEARRIEMQGKRPGISTADKTKRRGKKRRQKKDERDRNEVERFFSVDKRKFGAELIMTKLEETSLASIALSVLVANLFETNYVSFSCFFYFWLHTLSVLVPANRAQRYGMIRNIERFGDAA